MLTAWLLVSGPGFAEAQLPPVRAEGLAALVGGSHPGPGVAVVLRSDVELRANLHLWENGQRGVVPTGKLLQAAMEEIIGELLIAAEAERMQMDEPRPRDVGDEWDRIAAKLGGDAQLQEFLHVQGASEREIQEMAQRRATVAQFMSANLEGEGVVTEAAIDAALIAAGETAPQEVPAEERERIRELLSRQNFQRAVARWISVLKARTVVRICVQFSGS